MTRLILGHRLTFVAWVCNRATWEAEDEQFESGSECFSWQVLQYQPVLTKKCIPQLVGQVDYHDVNYHDVDYHDVDYHDVYYHDVDYNGVDNNDVDYNDVDYHDVDFHDIDYLCAPISGSNKV